MVVCQKMANHCKAIFFQLKIKQSKTNLISVIIETEKKMKLTDSYNKFKLFSLENLICKRVQFLTSAF